MSARLIQSEKSGRQMWFKGTGSACMREAKRLEVEQGIRHWQILCLDRSTGRWVLTI